MDLTIHKEELVIESIKALGMKVCPADISRQTGLSLDAVVLGLAMLVWDKDPGSLFWESICALVKDPGARPGEEAKSLSDCYNFIIGPSNPNGNINERKWQCIAKLIEQNNGSVIAEQLSPYTGIRAEDDCAVLSTLIRFNGRPVATDRGNLVYTFPSMSTTALEQSSLEQPLEPFLKERRLVLFGISQERVLLISCFLSLNAVWGICMAILAPLLCVLGMPLLGILAGVLAAFALVISICVLLRFPVFLIKSTTLFLRNSKRESYAKALELPSGQLKIRLQEAKDMALQSNYLSEGSTIFDSDRDALEQAFDQL